MMEDGVMFCLDQAVSVRKANGALDFVRIASIDPFLERARVVSPDMDEEVDMGTLSPLEMARDNLTWYARHPSAKLNIVKTYNIPVDYDEFHKAGEAAIKGEKELVAYMDKRKKDIIAFYNGKLDEADDSEDEAHRKAEDMSVLLLKYTALVRDLASQCDTADENNFIVARLRTILNEVFNANASIIHAAKANIEVVERYLPKEEKK
jgi:hypothetical protein